MAKLIDISISKGKGKPMIQLNQAKISVQNGIENDFHGKLRKRQVTVLSKKVWDDVCNELKIKLNWTSRRANLLIDDLDLENKMGAHIRIGDIVLEITGETEPCSRMDEVCQGLRKALKPSWRGGVTCKVIKGGIITVNDQVSIQPYQ